MAHTCNPSYLGGWDWEDCSLRPAWANSKTPVSTNSWAWCHIPVKIGGSWSRMAWRPHLQNKQNKKGVGGIAQAVERLSSKHKALNSTFSTTIFLFLEYRRRKKSTFVQLYIGKIYFSWRECGKKFLKRISLKRRVVGCFLLLVGSCKSMVG
jgi:hypothetical protein